MARSLSALSDHSHQHRGLGYLWLVWFTSPCTSRGLLLDTQPHISCAPRQVRRLFSVVSLRSSCESCGWHLPVLLRGAPFHVWLWWQHFESPEHLERHAVPASLTGEFAVNVNLTSCGALKITAALAADLDLDSLFGCSGGRSLSVFRRLASWHIRFTVLVSRGLWSEVRTATVEDIASFALTLARSVTSA